MFHYHNIMHHKTTIKHHIIISPFQGLCYLGGDDGCYKRFTLSRLE
ncbi:MAG: hypothetical protein JNM36_15495 [Chitinophagales bacterium]|nr:hypothetical protein [Chitinophagales bacterium]